MPSELMGWLLGSPTLLPPTELQRDNAGSTEEGPQDAISMPTWGAEKVLPFKRHPITPCMPINKPFYISQRRVSPHEGEEEQSEFICRRFLAARLMRRVARLPSQSIHPSAGLSLLLNTDDATARTAC